MQPINWEQIDKDTKGKVWRKLELHISLTVHSELAVDQGPPSARDQGNLEPDKKLLFTDPMFSGQLQDDGRSASNDSMLTFPIFHLK